MGIKTTVMTLVLLMIMTLRVNIVQETVAQATYAVLYVYPPVTYARVGDEVRVNIIIANVIDLYAWQVGLNFDPTILKFTNVSFLGPFPYPVGPSNYTPPEILLIGATMLGGVPGFTGTTVLATITFEAIAKGASNLIIRTGSPCEPWRSILIDSTQPPGDPFKEIPFTSQDGKVEIREPEYTYEKEDLEELDQHAKAKWGNCWCGPTAAGTSLAWFAENGYPDLVPDPDEDGIDEEDKYNVIDELGNYMKTDPNKGTSDADFVKGLEDYIDDAGYGDDFTVLQFPNPTYEQFIDELTSDEDVLLGIPHHWVVGSAVNEDPPPQDVEIMDPWTGSFEDTTWGDLKCDLMVSVSPVDSPTSCDVKLYGYVVVVSGITYVINGTSYGEVYVVNGQVFGVPDGTVYNTTGTVYGFANRTVIIENGTYFPVTGSVYIVNGTNRRIMPLIPDHDVAISKIKPIKTVVGHGYSVPINVTARNTGNQNETFTVTIYANTTTIQTKTLTLTRGTHTIITFTWNTTGFAKGNYTIWAYATPVPGETDTVDNTFVGGWVVVAMVGDINYDGKVDIKDVAMVSQAFGSIYINGQYMHPTPCPRCPHNPNTDINNDQVIDIKDVAIVSKQYGKIDP